MISFLLPGEGLAHVASLVSPKFKLKKDENQCVSFWYVHDGTAYKDKLTVYLRRQGKKKQELWMEQGEFDNDKWNMD